MSNPSQEFDSWADVAICSACCIPYRQEVEQQLEGFREKEEDICPYCGAVNHQSMTEEYYNYRMTDIEIDSYYKDFKC